MNREVLVSYINSQSQEGFSRAVLEETLLKAGWSAADIEAGFESARTPEPEAIQVTKPISKKGLSAIWFSFIVLSTPFVAIGSFYMLQAPVLNYQIQVPHSFSDNDVQMTNLEYGQQPALSDPDFFNNVRSEFIANKVQFIEADLTSMTLKVHKEEGVVLEVPIETTGREGSWWETPAGLYKVQSKSDRHFSSIGQVWMPWSMQFQGNFFIHGNTYYPDGTATSNSFTGGCIRLSTADAERVYKLVTLGTPILVLEEGMTVDSFSYQDNLPSLVDGATFISGDLSNNHIFAANRASEPVPIASITKLMTALIATEYINLDNSVTISESMIASTSKPRFKIGDKYSVYQLLFPLLLESSNEAGEAIARSYGRERFIKNMNDKALSVGMTNTVFADPSGISAGNISTAEDLFMLAKYIYHNRSFVFHITTGELKNSAYGTSGFADLGNFNYFKDEKTFSGGKNGQTTAAKETNLAVFDMTVGSTTRPIAIIVLGSKNVLADSEKILAHLRSMLSPR